MTPTTTKIAVGSDHAGYSLKQSLLQALIELPGFEFEDVGAYSEASVDYPDFAEAVAHRVAGNQAQLGILVCGTGIGVSIAANKVDGIRAAVCSEPYSARMSRAHNDANIICIGSRVVGLGLAQEIVKAFLETNFESGSRHQGRVDKITRLENC
jgi:ribose 5-phosphate isomerase B